MNVKDIIVVIQIFVSVLAIVFILLQGRGAGLGSAFGGGGEIYGSRRGIEKFLFYLTIGAVLLFFVTSLTSLILR